MCMNSAAPHNGEGNVSMHVLTYNVWSHQWRVAAERNTALSYQMTFTCFHNQRVKATPRNETNQWDLETRHNSRHARHDPTIKPNLTYLQCPVAKTDISPPLLALMGRKAPKWIHFPWAPHPGRWLIWISPVVACSKIKVTMWWQGQIKDAQFKANSSSLGCTLFALGTLFSHGSEKDKECGLPFFTEQKNGPRKWHIRGQTDSHSHLLFPVISLIPIPPLRSPSNQNKIAICMEQKLCFAIDGCLIGTLSCPIWDLTGWQGRGLYYKRNQWQRAISLSRGCHGSFCSLFCDR